MDRLAGKTAFITGAASGIGRATEQLFAGEGAKIVALDISEAGASTVKLIEDAGGEAIFVPTDVTSEGGVRDAFARGLDHFGRIDILHNNAGGSSGRDGSVVSAPIDELWRVLQLDLLGTILACRQAIPAMKASGGGAIINMTSIVTLIGVPNIDFYTAAKGAVSALTRTLAVQHVEIPIRVNALAPGVTMTERVMAASGGDVSAYPLARKQLLGPAAPIDVANAALFLASEEARKVTGVIMPVDGGSSAW